MWAILILSDPRHGKLTKSVAAAIGIISVAIIGYSVFGAAGLSRLTGPAQINFGSDYSLHGQSVSIVGPKTRFTSTEQIAWLVNLNAPFNTTKLDLSLSLVTSDKAEQVVERNQLNIADPNFSILYQKAPVWLVTLGMTGKFRLRLLSGDTVLAVGDFEVQ